MKWLLGFVAWWAFLIFLMLIVDEPHSGYFYWVYVIQLTFYGLWGSVIPGAWLYVSWKMGMKP